ncbi:NADH-quinone oxidoreductase subunit M [Roseomonas elaeocarpi]|uniref:NADH-quinone oxidoreductase subunit M n=1 Tax=Roseomonas elaeocarpi TaxID=907779 RepID=A0ABV6JSD9_9PROT
MTFLPLIGAAGIFFLRGEGEQLRSKIRVMALSTSLVVLALSSILWFGFDKSLGGYQFEEHTRWMPQIGLTYHMGVDGISVLFVVLTAFLTPVCILASWNSVQSRLREYMIAFLLLEMIMIGVFAALDLMLFYVFFEAALIPAFLIIGIWGGQRRVQAAFKLFLYTLAGAVLMLLAVLALWLEAGTTDLPALQQLQLPHATQIWMFLAFFAAFAVKMPMWPIHTWQPDAYAEAPTAGSIMLGGVMVNMGSYGFLRFTIPLLPDATQTFTPYVLTLAVIAVVYTSLIALTQQDMKKVVAYSSIAHMGIATIGIFSNNLQGVSGALLQMLAHGIVSGATFLCIGVLQDRMNTRQIGDFGGLAKVMPAFSVVAMIFTMATMALPGTASFPGEFLVIVGAWKLSPWVALGAASSMVLGAAYMLRLYRLVVFSRITRDEVRGLLDLSVRERLMFVPLVLVTIWMGLHPASFLQFFQASIPGILQP